MKYRRYDSIDVYRGLAVFIMLFAHFFVNLLSNYAPPFLEYGKAGQLSLGDLVTPMFLFIVGMVLFISVSKRRKQKKPGITGHILKRFSLLIILGLFLDMTAMVGGPRLIFTWGILEVIGLAGIITYFLLSFSVKKKILIIALIALVYSYLLNSPEFVSLILSARHGSVLGSFSWVIITLIGSIVGELLIKLKRKDFMLNNFRLSMFAIIIGFTLSALIPFNKNLVTPSYTIASAGIVSLIFLILFYLVEVKKISINALREFGTSALTVFVLQYILVIYPMYYFIGKTNFIGPVRALTITLLFTLSIWIIIKILNKRNIKLAF